MTKTKSWLDALRLRTLPLSLSGIILGSFVAKFYGYWDNLVFTFALITTILFQILSNLANDLGDSLKGTDNEHRVGPARTVQAGLITRKEMQNAVIFTSILSFIAAGILIYFGTKNMPVSTIWFYAALAIACVLAAITYTIGKRAYGYNGLGDLMVFIFFGLVSVMGVYPLFAKSIDYNTILPATCIGLLSAAVLNLNNMRDIENDKNSGKNTLVVMLGSSVAKFYHSFLILGSFTFLAIFIFNTGHFLALIGLIPYLILVKHLITVWKTKNPREFDPELKKVSLSTFAIAVLTSIGLMI